MIFDSIEAGLINFNFEYFNLNNNENKIAENSNLFSLKLTKAYENIDLDIDLQKKINGERVGINTCLWSEPLIHIKLI